MDHKEEDGKEDFTEEAIREGVKVEMEE